MVSFRGGSVIKIKWRSSAAGEIDKPRAGKGRTGARMQRSCEGDRSKTERQMRNCCENAIANIVDINDAHRSKNNHQTTPLRSIADLATEGNALRHFAVHTRTCQIIPNIPLRTSAGDVT